MTEVPMQQAHRLDRRKARTRDALIRAAQTLFAEDRTTSRSRRSTLRGIEQ